MISMGMSSKGASDHQSKQAVNQEANVSIEDYGSKYQNDLFWPKHITQICLTEKKSPICFSC